MKLLTTTFDKKIGAANHLIEISIGQYIDIAKDIINNNDLQRKRVKTANRTYSLLKEDIKTGCVIPPIVLAIPKKLFASDIDDSNIIDLVIQSGKELLILDGLQRTYTILDLINEIKNDTTLLSFVSDQKLRIEVYTGISKIGILYRMLTLNTGQTPMSTRQQVEMIYSDYKTGFSGLVFISEAENRVPSGDNEFRFNDILDGFISYITGDYLPLDREDLIGIIKNLEVLTKNDTQKDIFQQLISIYNKLRKVIYDESGNWQFNSDEKIRKRPFGKNSNEIFSKVQVLAGYGAAINFLIENGLIKNLDALDDLISKINLNNIEFSLEKMILYLDEINIIAKKVGNEQRMYFYYFIRSLFNNTNDGYLSIEKSVEQAYKFYKANMLG